MTSVLQRYIEEYTDANSYVLQSDVALQLQVH